MEQPPTAVQGDDELDDSDWCLIDAVNSNCILPSVLASDAATAGWGSSFMQRAKTRLFMSLSRAPKELPSSAYGPAPIWLLGARCNDADDFRQRCTSLLWFSYRQGFPPIEPSTLTSEFVRVALFSRWLTPAPPVQLISGGVVCCARARCCWPTA